MMNGQLATMIVAALLWVQSPAAAGAGPSLVQVRQLYESASYELALGLLDQLQPSDTASVQDQQDARRYRVLCLVALDRNADAERVLDDMLRVDPLTPPMSGELSPRVEALVKQARQRAVRSLVKQTYEQGRELYERKQFADAADLLQMVVSLIEDPSLGLESDPSLADFHALADGFHELASALAAAQAASIPTASLFKGPTPVPAAALGPAQRPPVQPARSDFPAASVQHRPGEPDFVAPRPIAQVIPPVEEATSGYVSRRQGLIEVEVGADGSVTSATVKVPTLVAYDALLVTTAKRTWKYEPATSSGVPVASRLRVRYVVASQPASLPAP